MRPTQMLAVFFVLIHGAVVNAQSSTGDQQSNKCSIQILDADGNALAGISVKISLVNADGTMSIPQPQISDSNGLVSLPKHQIDAAQQVTILASNPNKDMKGLATFYDRSKIKLRPGRTYKLSLEPTVTVTGTVVDFDSGKAISGCTVSFLNKLKRSPFLQTIAAEGKTDRNGQFKLPGAISGIPGYIRIGHADYLEPESFRSLVKPGDDIKIEIVSKTVPDNPRIERIVAPDTAGLSDRDAFEKLDQAFAKANDEFRSYVQQSNNATETTAYIQRRLPYRVFLDAMLNLANQTLDENLRAKALAWCVKVPMHTAESNLDERYRMRTEIGDRIVSDHLQSPEIEDALTSLVYSQKDVAGVVQKIMDKNPKKSIQGKSLMLLSDSQMRRLEMSERMKSFGGKHVLTDEQQSQLETEVKSNLKRIVEEYGEIPYWRDGTLGNVAQKHLFELNSLIVGKPAPEIAGLDQNGNEMKLSDFRGKIVVLDFWASWCGPCKNDLPELNRLAKKYPDDVEVLGVMSDNRPDALRAIDENDVIFSNWIEPEGGPITDKWNIDSWPTSFILDRDGIIRHLDFAKTVGAENFRLRVEAMLRDQKRDK